ncbi:MAG: hypothetical protein B6I31_03260 [Desulfobacteraceae bacterium 4572_19]|nr:MAG: hypothetical protein B6I31_03260 [Desulfobacteraceae bacterium 4572_19]
MNNKFEIKGSLVEVIVPHKKSGEQFTFTLDVDDLKIIQSKASWGMDKNKTSAVANFRQEGKACKITMHRLLTDVKNINFADKDRFNLRRENLVASTTRKRRRESGVYLKGNDISVSGDTLYMQINNPTASGTVLIDRADRELISQYTWNINPVNGYVQTRIRKGREHSTPLYMHRLLMGACKGDSQVDHIDRNRLNNKRSNLRFVTWSENQLNKGLGRDNTLGFRGVCLTKDFTFRAQLKVMNKTLAKTFKTFEEAKAQRIAWEKEHEIPHL